MATGFTKLARDARWGQLSPEECRRLLRGGDSGESRLLNEAFRLLLLEGCGRLAGLFLLLLDLELGEDWFGERELSEYRLSDLCSSLDKTSIVECRSFW
jgi:hypothetical protein